MLSASSCYALHCCTPYKLLWSVWSSHQDYRYSMRASGCRYVVNTGNRFNLCPQSLYLFAITQTPELRSMYTALHLATFAKHMRACWLEVNRSVMTCPKKIAVVNN